LKRVFTPEISQAERPNAAEAVKNKANLKAGNFSPQLEQH
jgi:hypothetical protein